MAMKQKCLYLCIQQLIKSETARWFGLMMSWTLFGILRNKDTMQ